MTRSLNETAALCKRAARGAGLRWGIAEEAAWAARWLAGFGLPGPGALASLLAEHEIRGHAALWVRTSSEVWRGESGALCPLSAGTALADCARELGLSEGREIRMHGVLQPLLLLPFAESAAEVLAHPVKLCWQGVQATCDGTLSIAEAEPGALGLSQADVTCCATSERGRAFAEQRLSRHTAPAQVWESLDRFARRTYAPATEASRLLGAGAGDND